ncbi:MAG: calcineurin-like phosphoesterase family protein [Candidatus Palauibacterales bacterium]|nr:calcineurin-like phosphoesterase family protein [Candidatus Palauibacterales bacterium]
MDDAHVTSGRGDAAPGDLTRRDFLGTASLAGASLLLPLGGASALLDRTRSGVDEHFVRVRGRVVGPDGGLEGVAVTDGLDVVTTGEDGRFRLAAGAARGFVYVSIPSGYRIPRSSTGTARFYRRLDPGAEEQEVLFELQPLRVSDEEHAFLLLADIQTETPEEMARFHERTVPDLKETVADLGAVPTFGLACGDIMYDRLELFDRYERAVSRIDLPFFQAVGNHDLDMEAATDIGSTATFTRRFGPRYYSFDRGAVHYVVLDDVHWHGRGYLGYLDRDQLTWLENDLRHVEPGRRVVVALHIPVLGTSHLRVGRDEPVLRRAVTNRDRLYELLEPYRAHIVSGHTHENEHSFQGPVHEHVSGTVSGAWWTGPICADGTPSGYSVYRARGEHLEWRYRATGRSADHQLRTYPAGSDPQAPDEFVANVWDWDPEWTVVWYEGADRRGRMARRTGRDPLSVELHRGEEKPEKRPWVDPYSTRHLFYAPAPESDAEVVVEATDRFGRTYSARLSADGEASRRSPAGTR